MKNNKLLTVAVFGLAATAVPALAFAEDIPAVPGSETTIEQHEAAQRDAVAADDGAMTTNSIAAPLQQTLVPGSDAGIRRNEAAERDAVAAGTSAETRTVPTTEDDVLVPGSGVTFTPGEQPKSERARALQDEAPGSRVQ